MSELPPPIVIDLISRMDTSGASIDEMWRRLIMVGVFVEREVVRKCVVQPSFRTSPQHIAVKQVANTSFSSFDAQIGTDISCGLRSYGAIIARDVRNVRFNSIIR